jgi:DNA-binding NtrC family response regulator
MADDAAPTIAGGARLLVLANDDGRSFRTLLAGSEIEPTTLRDVDTAMDVLAGGRMDALVIAFDLATAPALDVLAQVLERWELPVLLYAPSGAISSSRATSLGAAAVLTEPLTAASLLYTVRSALAVTYADEPEPLPAHAAAPARDPREILLGESSAMKRVHELIGKVAPGIATVLVRGETGTGKELVARAIHGASDRATGPLVTIHCGALPDNLLESELFGYEKGAFTGADQRKEGRVDHAQGGTLFLDEIGDVTPAIQVKLLRLLQDRQYQRLGGREALAADVRFVAATHRDLDGMVKAGEFREDLFYRLNVVPLWVPPLRARKKDVELLARSFCERFATANQREGTQLGDDAMKRITRHRWPGNVRQLQNFIERLVVLHGGTVITAADVESELSGGSPFKTEGDLASRSITSMPSTSTPGSVVQLDEAVAKAERKAILAALHAAEGNRSQAARLLGVSRATFYNKLKDHDLP